MSDPDLLRQPDLHKTRWIVRHEMGLSLSSLNCLDTQIVTTVLLNYTVKIGGMKLFRSHVCMECWLTEGIEFETRFCRDISEHSLHL